MKDLVTTARKWARILHANQKHGDRPYIEHCAEVVAILFEYGHVDDDILAAAWLHDVAEDCGVDINAIHDRFGERVANLVWACTGVGDDRAARNASIADKVRMFPPAAVIKIADRIDNVRACIKNNDRRLSMYRKEHAAFRVVVAGFGYDDMVKRLDELIGWREMAAA